MEPRWTLGIVASLSAEASERGDYGAGSEAVRIFASNSEGVCP
jgi:hypothetical protein